MGRTLTCTYNGTQLTGVSDGTRSVSYTYDGAGNLASYADSSASPAVTTFAYDQPGRMTRMFYPSFPTTASMTNVYGGLGRVQSQSDALGNLWTYLFTNATRAQEVDPAGGSHVLYYDQAGNQTANVDQTGAITRMTYDGVGRLATLTTPAGVVATNAYDLKSNLLSRTTTPIAGVTDPFTGQTAAPTVQSFTYDATFNKVLAPPSFST